MPKTCRPSGSQRSGILDRGAAAPTDHLYYSVVPHRGRRSPSSARPPIGYRPARYHRRPSLRRLQGEPLPHLRRHLLAEPIIKAGKDRRKGLAPRPSSPSKPPTTSRSTPRLQGLPAGRDQRPIARPAVYAGGPGRRSALSPPSFKNETVWNFEAGAKARLGGGAGSLTAAAFYADISNLQVIDVGSCSSRIIAT